MFEDDAIFGNVIYMKNLIGKYVEIKTIDNKLHRGNIFVIDPIYRNVILTDDTDNSLKLIYRHAIKELKEIDGEIKQEFLQKPTVVDNSNGEMLVRKKRLIRWLQHMFINVKDKDEYLEVEDHLRIESPFTIDECFCENTIILDRIRNIINLMPESFE